MKICSVVSACQGLFCQSAAGSQSCKAGFHRQAASFLSICLALTVGQVLATGQGFAQDSTYTYHYDTSRSGQVSDETILIPANVNSTKFGLLFSYPVDGFIAAQPLYVPGVTIPGQGVHNVVYVVTQHDSVFAFDSDNPGGAPLWQVSFINPANGVTTVPISEQLCSGTGFTEMGILGTPVIDPTSGTIYISVKTREQSGTTVNYVHRLHALDITTGAEKFGGPVVVLPNGSTTEFNTLSQCQRPALLLSNGTLFVVYGSNGCDLKSHGWIMAYNPSTLQQLATFNTSPNYAWGSSIWMSGGGMAADADGYLYVVTANGPFDAYTGGPDYGDTVLKLSYANGAFTVVDYFTPYNQLNMDDNDLDLGSGGLVLLPDQSSGVTHELVTSGKTGTIYLINRDSMGGYNSTSQNDDQIVQPIPGALGLFDSVPVYWNNTLYFAAHSDTVKSFSLSDGMLSWNPVAQSIKYAQVGVPVVSSSGTTNGILWNIHNPTTPELSALDAITLAELYNSSQKGTRDTLGMVAHFVTPMVANNKVFVGTTTSLNVYGVFPYLSLAEGNNQSAAAGTTLPYPITVQTVNSQGVGVAGVTVNFTASVSGGTFSNPSPITDNNGLAQTSYTLPTKAQSVGFTVAATGYRPVLLSALGVAGPPAVISKIQGVGQTGVAGTTLPIAVEVKLADAFNNPAPGLAVTFSDGTPHGSFSANPVLTNAIGIASVNYTLPTSTLPTGSKNVIVTATYGGLVANIAEKNVAGPAVSQSVFSGNNQKANPGITLKTPLTVVITDQYGNPVPATTVTFSDGGVGGTFSSTTASTNNVGNAFVTYTLPSTAQVVNVSASASGVPTVNFTETAQ